MGKGKESGYYGVKLDDLYVNNLALVKLRYGMSVLFEEDKIPFATFESIDENTLKGASLIQVGFGIPLAIDDKAFVHLYNKRRTLIPYYVLLDYFKTGRKTFSIDSDFEYPAVKPDHDNKYNKNRLYHHLPNYYSYSGSPIAYVDKDGVLHPFAIQSGGFLDWNIALTSNHPFLSNII